MGLVAAGDAQELLLCTPVFRRNMAAAGTGLAGVLRRHRQQQAAAPVHLLRQRPPELGPALIENAAVQTGLLPNLLAGPFAPALGRAGHVFYPQILNTDERVVLADRGGGLVQEIFTGIGCVHLLNFGFFLFPVLAEFDLARHSPLVTRKALLVLLEAVERCNETAVAQGGKARNADIDAYGRGVGWHRLGHLPLGLDAGVPLDSALTQSHVPCHARNVPAVAVAHPAQFRQFDAAVGLIDLELLGVWVAQAVALPFLLEAREGSPFGEEIGVGALQILERPLQRVARCMPWPRRLRAVAPLGEQLAHPA